MAIFNMAPAARPGWKRHTTTAWEREDGARVYINTKNGGVSYWADLADGTPVTKTTTHTPPRTMRRTFRTAENAMGAVDGIAPLGAGAGGEETGRHGSE